MLMMVLWPLLAYTVVVILMVAIIIGLSYILGERHEDKATHEVFESGIIATGTSRIRFPAHFYLVAMFFVIFDLETAFIVTWAVAFRELGWVGYIAILVFIVELGVVLFYIWKMGALDFGPSGKKILEAYHKITRKKD
jgi:NADH-quinone oxidoreductase subunit A